jgi:RNA polymerase sigma-70 factor (ECF subfamily)
MDKMDVDGLFRAYRGSVFRRARSILGDPDAANDVTSEVFLKATSLGSGLAKLDSPMAWLYRVTTNLCLKRRRDSARRRQALGARLVPAAPPPSSDLPIDAALTVQKLLDSVPEELHELAIYYYVDRMSQEEISKMVGMPRRTVSYRLEQFRVAALAGDGAERRASS